MKKLILLIFVLLLFSVSTLGANNQYNYIENNYSAIIGAALNSSSNPFIIPEIGDNFQMVDSPITVDAYIGNGMRFNGTNQYLDLNYTIDMADAFAISFWIQSENKVKGDALFGADTTDHDFHMRIDETYEDGLQFHVDDGGASQSNTRWLGAWANVTSDPVNFHHIVFMKAGGGSHSSQLRLYIDGVNMSTPVPAAEQVVSSQDIDIYLAWNTKTGWMNATYDELLIWDNTTICDGSIYPLCVYEIQYLYNTTYPAPPAPPPPDVPDPFGFINFTGLNPLNNTQYNFNTLNFNTSVNATNDFTARLYFNGTLNQTRTFSAGVGVFVSFNETMPDGAYSFNINASETLNASRNDTAGVNSFYVDTTYPTLTTAFLNGSIFYRNNLTGVFNFNDEIMLYSFNITIDGYIQVANKSDLNVTSYTYNLSYNISTFSLGQHNLTVRFTDGHTSNILGGDYDFSNGLFNDYSKYKFWDGGWIKTESKDNSLFDSWTSKKEVDRYTQEFAPNNPSATVTLIEESDLPIHIINKPGHYNGYWIITGNHWKDYVLEDEPNAEISIKRINDYKVEVTITGIKNTELLKFSSIGELNIVEQTFNFTVTEATSTYSSQVNELESQTISFGINVTGDISSTNADLFYDGSQKTVTKTSFTAYDLYSITFTTPEVSETVAYEIKSFYWNYRINGSGANESGSINGSQTVFRIGLDNCSNYSMRALDIYLRDENTDLLINGSINGFFRTWIDSINDYTTHSISWHHDVGVGLCIFPNSSTYYSYAQIEYSGTGYDTKLYYFDNTTFDNVSETLNLYLNNGTTQVTFTVTDFNDIPIEDVIIKVLTYDIGTDTSTTTEILNTDTDGVALAQIVLNTQWYRFILEIDGEVVLATEPTKITSTTKKFRISLITDYFDRFTDVIGIEHLLRFTNETLLFDFIYSDTTGGINQACLKVIRKGLNADFIINDTCVTSAASTISTRINESVGTNTYEGTAYVVFSDGEYFVLDKLIVSFDNKYRTYGVSGIFVSFMFVLVLVLVGVWSPPISVAFMAIGLFISLVLDIVHVGWETFIAFIIVAIVTMYKVGKK